MKAQIKARHAELWDCVPSDEELQGLCWDIWSLTTFHIAAGNAVYGADTDACDHAPYIPPELAGERAERIQAMDARLHEALGDAVDEETDEEEDDDTLFDFQPGPEEQLTMVEYGSIIVEHREFVEHFNKVQLAPGDEGYVMNIIQLHRNGFDVLMRQLWEFMQQLGIAQ